MEFLNDPQFWASWFKIAIIDLTLAAILVALAWWYSRTHVKHDMPENV